MESPVVLDIRDPDSRTVSVSPEPIDPGGDPVVIEVEPELQLICVKVEPYSPSEPDPLPLNLSIKQEPMETDESEGSIEVFEPIESVDIKEEPMSPSSSPTSVTACSSKVTHCVDDVPAVHSQLIINTESVCCFPTIDPLAVECTVDSLDSPESINIKSEPIDLEDQAVYVDRPVLKSVNKSRSKPTARKRTRRQSAPPVSRKEKPKKIPRARKVKICEVKAKKIPKEIKCDICLKVLSRNSVLKQHKLIHLRTPLTCIKCYRVFETETELEEHTETHKFRCSMCGNAYFTYYQLKSHVQIHSDTPPMCYICKKMLTSERNLVHHMKTHDAARKRDFSCEFCSKTFISKQDCNDHLKTHIKQYKCTVCGKEFSRKFHLKTHLLKHLGLREQKCEECGKCFSTVRYLRVHLLTHRPPMFECEHCDAMFNRKRNLARHLLQHVPPGERVRVLCPMCGKSYGTEASLKVHLRSHHSDVMTL